ncbi:hypothetical protein ES705_11622 [subsurface metagenome]
MSSQIVEKKVLIFPSDNTDKEDSINFNEIIIPFSNFGSSQSLAYIYNGNENIKFNKRHPVYRRLLLNEFHKI